MREIKCRKCGHEEKIYVNHEEKTVSTYSRKDSFYCKSCELLSVIDTTNEKFFCKNCHSQNLTKFFSENKVKCPKCGNKMFDAISKIDF